MAAEKLNAIFQPFSQADTSTTRKFGGTGLGLTISSQLIEKMGSNIAVESEPGIGSTFYFRLDFPLLKEEDFPDQPDTIMQRPYKQLSTTRVLLVEDNEINRELATEVLERNELVVDTAIHGQEALEKLKRRDYDLVLMDIQMPVMDGYEATWAIRNQLKRGNLPIIALTASTSSVVREKCMRAGMDDYISKPIDIHELMEKIDKILNPVLHKFTIEQTSAPSSKAVATPDFQHLPGIDAPQAMHRLALGPEDYLRLLKKFATSHQQDMKQINNLVLEQKWEAASRIAHTLKGLSSTIGAARLSELAARLEQTLKNVSTSLETTGADGKHSIPEDLATLLGSTEADLDKIVQHIEGHQQAPEISPKPSEQSIDLPDKLNALLMLTEGYNVAAVAEVNTLLSLITDNAIISDLQNIQDDLENFDFDTATASLKTLLVHL